MNLKDYLYLEWIETASDEELINFIEKISIGDPLIWQISHLIGNASDEVKMKLVKVNPRCCGSIPNCSYKIQLEAVKLGCPVFYFENPSEEMWLEYIVKSEFDPNVIYECKDWKKLREKILDLAMIKDIIE